MIHVYTDGGCSGNPGPGGWAYVIIKDSELIAEKWGAERSTTNNRMELQAVIAALKTLPNLVENKENVSFFTDSQYVQKGISEWIRKWKQNSWRTGDKKPVKNQDLWRELDAVAGEFSITWTWVKGHAGNKFNERCDDLTQKAIASL